MRYVVYMVGYVSGVLTVGWQDVCEMEVFFKGQVGLHSVSLALN